MSGITPNSNASYRYNFEQAAEVESSGWTALTNVKYAKNPATDYPINHSEPAQTPKFRQKEIDRARDRFNTQVRTQSTNSFTPSFANSTYLTFKIIHPSLKGNVKTRYCYRVQIQKKSNRSHNCDTKFYFDPNDYASEERAYSQAVECRNEKERLFSAGSAST